MFREYLVISFVTMSLMSLELLYTRIFSAEFYYTFTFLIVSLAVLGLGIGALYHYLFPLIAKGNNLGLILSLIGFIGLTSPPIILRIGLDLSNLLYNPIIIFKLIIVILLLSFPFFLGGIVLAKLFKDNFKIIPKLYMSDLLGAGTGVVLCFTLMNILGTANVVFLSLLPVLIASFLISKKWIRFIPVGLCVLMLFCTSHSESLLMTAKKDEMPVIYRHWDAMAKIKIYQGNNYIYGLNIDNASNSPIYRFDGNWNSPYAQSLQFAVDVGYLIRRFESCNFLSLGAGGGMDVMQALQKGATEIHAVEVNPAINDLMLEGKLAKLTGYIYKDPRVKVITEDARNYVRKFKNKFDIIYSYSSNSYAAFASGAFALAENYLFTSEAFEDYWNALSENGFLVMEHKYYMPRIVSSVKQAFKKLRIDDINNHIAVYNMPKMKRKILLLSKKPLNNNVRENALGNPHIKSENYTYLLYPAPDYQEHNIINQIINKGWSKSAEWSKINIKPTTDNQPFIAQLGLWKNLTKRNLISLKPFEFEGFPISDIIILCIIFIILVLILPLNVLPIKMKASPLKLVPGIYFLLIGMAFMAIEIILIQKFTLFLGASVYSMVIILVSILFSSGLGSRLVFICKQYISFAIIILWLILICIFFPNIVSKYGHIPLTVKVIISVMIIFPMGFFMGMPFPLGASKIKSHIDWGFAINGMGSVFGAALIVLIAINMGFNLAIITGILLYSCAFFLLMFKNVWEH